MKTFKKLCKLSSIVFLLCASVVSISATSNQASMEEQGLMQTHVFEKAFDFDGTMVELKIAVEMRNNEAIKEIYRCIGASLKVAADEVDEVRIENESISVWSEGDCFPTNQLLYAFSGTLVGEGNQPFSYSGTIDLNEEKIEKRIDVIPYVFKTTSNIEGTDVMLQIHVELYCNGSFREIKRCLGGTINVVDVNHAYIEDELVSVWSRNDDFPTTRLMYAYSGTLDVDEAFSQSSDAFIVKTGIFDLYVE